MDINETRRLQAKHWKGIVLSDGRSTQGSHHGQEEEKKSLNHATSNSIGHEEEKIDLSSHDVINNPSFAAIDEENMAIEVTYKKKPGNGTLTN